MSHPYAILDVFTQTPLAGNPLAIVRNAQDLSDEQMQKIAKEFNLSETVFVMPAQDEVNTAQIRIFTSVYEMPFAGHPTIGTACYLAQKADAGARGNTASIILEENIGTVHCAVDIDENGLINARFDTPDLPVETDCSPAPEAYAAALGLEPADIGFAHHVPTNMTLGVPYTCVPLASRNAIARARPNLENWADAFGDHSHNDAYVYCPETDDPKCDYCVRMFAPFGGAMEDPATGSAAAAFSGVIAKFEKPSDGSHLLVLEQGIDMGRPSIVELGIIMAEGELVAASIGGSAVLIAEGVLHL